MSERANSVKRQPFGPNETDINLCYYVCWDESAEPEDGVAERWAHFTNDDDAVAYFNVKAKDAKLFVWKGELGVSKVDGHFDWFHTQWSSNLAGQLKSPKSGMGYRWTNDAFEEFDRLDFEEEEN